MDRATQRSVIAMSCPVQHNKASPSNGEEAARKMECPVRHNASNPGDEGDINPKNNMPATANQSPWPGQKSALSRQRVESSIPKSDADETWVYPSPQMFYNAVKRKGSESAEEKDMDLIVAIHNNMNERTWKNILQWEKLRQDPGAPNPTLSRFCGKDTTLSPKARLKMLIGYPKPFDRHDWIVNRNGKEVRYVIDYYMRPDTVGPVPQTQVIPSLYGGGTTPIEVDVRPAIESLESLIDRIRCFPERFMASLEARRIINNHEADEEVRLATLAAETHRDMVCNQPPFLLKSSTDSEGPEVGSRPSPRLAWVSGSVKRRRQPSTFAWSPSTPPPLTSAQADNTATCQSFAATYRQVLSKGGGLNREEREAFMRLTGCLRAVGAEAMAPDPQAKDN